MKALSLLITLLILVSSLNARENPFMPSKAYQDEVARLIEIDENYPKEFTQSSSNNIETEDMTPILRESDVNKPVATAIEKTEEEIKKENMEKEAALKKEKALEEALKKVAEAKKLAQKEKMEKEAALAKAKALEEQGPMVYVKKRDDIVVDNKLEILPYLNIEYTNESLTLISDYKVFKKFHLLEENKLIIDFKGEVTFFTKRNDLESAHFKKIIVGNHQKDKYFRVVLVLKESPIKYEVSYTKDSVFINFNEEMSK